MRITETIARKWYNEQSEDIRFKLKRIKMDMQAFFKNEIPVQEDVSEEEFFKWLVSLCENFKDYNSIIDYVLSHFARKWYDEQSDDVRMELQVKFGRNDETNREVKFFKWLAE